MKRHHDITGYGKTLTVLLLCGSLLVFSATFSNASEEYAYGGESAVITYNSTEVARYATEINIGHLGAMEGAASTSLQRHSDWQPSTTLLQVLVTYEDGSQEMLISSGSLATDIKLWQEEGQKKIKKLLTYHYIDAGTYRKYESYTGAKDETDTEK